MCPGPIWSRQEKARKKRGESPDRRHLEPSELRMLNIQYTRNFFNVFFFDVFTFISQYFPDTISISVNVWIGKKKKLGYLVCVITEGQFVLQPRQSRSHTHTNKHTAHTGNQARFWDSCLCNTKHIRWVSFTVTTTQYIATIASYLIHNEQLHDDSGCKEVS